jgi:signal peptidase II
MPEAGRGGLRWLGLSAAIVALDLASKAWMSGWLRLGESREVTPFFNLVMAHNTGAAFSFLAGAGGWQRWFFIAVSVVVATILVVLLKRNATNRLLGIALALVLGGAIGNLHDRITLGHVVDFIQVHAGGYHFPAFNVADSAITIGVALLVWDGFRGSAGPAARNGGASP